MSADHALSQAMTQDQRDRAAAAMRAGWAFRFDPVRLEFTAARELLVDRTLDGLLGKIEAGPS